MLVGTIYLFAGSSVPSGFLLCDGSAISRSTYASVFSVIGTTYGAGDGSTTFNLPDLTGKVVIGASSTHALGATGGEETHALLDTEMPSHTHGIAAHTHAHTIKATTPQLTHTITQPAYKYNKPGTHSQRSASSAAAYTGTTSTNATRSANLVISNHAATACTMGGGVTDCDAFNSESSGSGTAHSNMQPYMTMNYIIYVGG